MKQGEKLLLLARRDQRSSEEIAEAMGIDKSYLPRLYKMDILPPKPLKKAQEVFGVPIDYFLSEAESPSLLNEAAVRYRGEGLLEGELERLRTEIGALREEITRLNKMLEQEKSINTALSEAILNMSKRSA